MNETKENLKPVAGLKPFKHFCMSIGELPASYLETMTYYEMLVWFTKYLGDTVIPTINNNAECIEELQNKYIEFTDDITEQQNTFETNITNQQNTYEEHITGLFNELQTFVNNYFDNLDVQEEINNKLDDMVKDGTLQEIITTYIQSQVTWTFSTVNDMKESTNLINGSYAKTLGYYTANDGGGAYYVISNEKLTEDNGSVIELNSGLFAVLVPINNTIYTKQFGAVGDGTTDDKTAIQTLLNYVVTNYNNGCKIIVNALHYIDGTLNLKGTDDNKLRNISILGLEGNRSYSNNESLKYGFIFKAYYDIADFQNKFGLDIDYSVGLTIKYLKFTTDEVVENGEIPLNNISLVHFLNSSSMDIERCNFTNAFIGYHTYGSGLATISNNNVALCNIGMRIAEAGDSTFENNYINTCGWNIYNLDGTLKSAYATLYTNNLVYGYGYYIGGSGNHTIKGGKVEWNNVGIWEDNATNMIYDDIQFDRCTLSGISITGRNTMITHSSIVNCNFNACGGINPASGHADRHIGGLVRTCIGANSANGLIISNNKFIGDNGSLKGAFKTSSNYYAPLNAIFFDGVYDSAFVNNYVNFDGTYLGQVNNSEILYDGNITNLTIYTSPHTIIYKRCGNRRQFFNTTDNLTYGNFDNGDIITNNTLLAGYKCTGNGTLKSINTTVSVITEASEFYPGDYTVIDCGTSYVQGVRSGAYVNITGVTGTKKIIDVIKRNGHYYAKLNSACDVAVTNATMTNQTPTFTTY